MTSPMAGGRSPRVVLVACRRWPALSRSDERYKAALQALGAQVDVAAWNAADDQLAFQEADLVVIRSSWDYHDAVTAYRGWLSQLEADGIAVLNDVATVTRFLDKEAFAELAGDEVEVPHSRVCRADHDAVSCVLSVEGWDRAVLKPVNGASGRGVQLVTPETVGEKLAAVKADVGERDVLVQAFIPEIANGETQFVLFDGKVSHAVVKRPRPGEFRTNSAFTPVVELLPRLPPTAERIEAMVQRMAVQPLYARVDVVMRETAPVLLEFEVNEPGLWLDVAPPGAAEVFARATLARLRD